MAFRGAQIAPLASVSDLQALLQNGAKLIRYQVFAPNPSTWMQDVNASAEHFRFNLTPLINAYGARAILDLHSPPPEKPMAEIFWKAQAEMRYGTNVIFGLINEPRYIDSLMWQKKLIKIIRGEDPTRKVSIQPRNSTPDHFKNLKPFSYSNLDWYEAHMYYPMNLTHQGIGTNPIGVKYPTAKINKAKLLRVLQPVRDFQLKYDQKIIIGEFGCNYFTDPDSRYNWFRDCLDIFKMYKWNWVLHAWREWEGWSVEQDHKIFTMFKRRWN